MSSEESDVEMHGSIARKPISSKRLIKAIIPKSPTEESLPEEPPAMLKLSTRDMVNKALAFLDTRKGVSLYAIKKYIETNFQVNTEKYNHHIKKYIKSGIEKGTILKTKGVGASGSFRLAPKKDKVVKKKKPKVIKDDAKKTAVTEKEKSNKSKSSKNEKSKKKEKDEKLKKDVQKTSKTKEKLTEKASKTSKLPKTKKKAVAANEKLSGAKNKKTVEIKLPKTHMPMTPGQKKKILTKRKSIGSIIKPPKMKPKSMKTAKAK